MPAHGFNVKLDALVGVCCVPLQPVEDVRGVAHIPAQDVGVLAGSCV